MVADGSVFFTNMKIHGIQLREETHVCLYSRNNMLGKK